MGNKILQERGDEIEIIQYSSSYASIYLSIYPNNFLLGGMVGMEAKTEKFNKN